MIWFGTNDAAPPPSSVHVPLVEYTANLKSLVAMARSTACTARARILLVTPPPVSEAQWSETGHDARKAEVTREYAGAVADVVRELKGGESGDEKVALVDMWTAVWKAAGETEEGLRPLLSDGLHFTPEGYRVCMDVLFRYGNTDADGAFASRLFTIRSSTSSRTSSRKCTTGTSKTHSRLNSDLLVPRPLDSFARLCTDIDYADPGLSLQRRQKLRNV